MLELSENEAKKKTFFEFIINSFEPTCLLEKWEKQFHLAMQNPVAEVISFTQEEATRRNFLHNGNLAQIEEYFTADGTHLFEKSVTCLVINNARLSDYYNNENPYDQMPDGTEYIARLIAKNPKIKTIDLSNTYLGDHEAMILLRALETNTHLSELKLDGNKISAEILQKIILKINKPAAEIPNSPRLNVVQNSALILFSTLPEEVCPIKPSSDNLKPNSDDNVDRLGF